MVPAAVSPARAAPTSQPPDVWPEAPFPFGAGPRVCIGQGFAMLEATLILAILAQQYDFRLVPGQAIELDPLITLRAKNGIRMTVARRSA